MRIIPRAEWGARYANGCSSASLPAVEVWLHHSTTRADNGPAIIRELEAIGQSRFGCGISYTWPITPDGTVYEGHSVDRLGTHTGGRNSIARAICFVGNYEIDHPTDAQIRSAAWLLQHAHAAGWIDAPRLDGGHRDLKATACPGRYAYAAIPTINQLAAGGPIQEEDMPLTFEEINQIWEHPCRGLDPETGQWETHKAVEWLTLAAYRGAHQADDEAKLLAAIRDVQAAVEAEDAVVTPEQLEQLADALAARGIGGVTAAELIDILSGVRLAPAQPEGSTTR